MAEQCVSKLSHFLCLIQLHDLWFRNVDDVILWSYYSCKNGNSLSILFWSRVVVSCCSIGVTSWTPEYAALTASKSVSLGSGFSINCAMVSLNEFELIMIRIFYRSQLRCGCCFWDASVGDSFWLELLKTPCEELIFMPHSLYTSGNLAVI